MQLANQRPGKSDTLSQHAVAYTSYPNMQFGLSKAREVRHTIPACNRNMSGKLDMLSQHTQHRHAIPVYTAKPNLYKRGCKSPEQWTS